MWSLLICSIIGAHTDEQQDLIVQGLDKSQQSLHSTLDPSPWQATNLPEQQVKVSRWEPLPPAGGSLPLLLVAASFWCYCLVQAQLALMLCWTEVPSLSFTIRVLNLFCSCRSMGRAGAFLLITEVTSFQPLPSWESPFPTPISIDSGCPSFSAVGDSGLCICRVLEKIQLHCSLSSLMLCSLLTSSPSSFTCQPAHSYRQRTSLRAPVSTKDPRHSLVREHNHGLNNRSI